MALNPAELTVIDSNSHSFSVWLDRTNEMIQSLTANVVTVDTSNTGGVTVGNGYVDGVFAGDVLVANSGLRGGNVQTSGTLYVISNTIFGASGNTVETTHHGDIEVHGTVNVNGTVTTEILEISIRGNALTDGIPLGNSSHGFDVYARDLYVAEDASIDNNLTVANTISTLDIDVTGRADVEDLFISNTGGIYASGTANGEGVPIGSDSNRFLFYGTTIYASNSVNVGANVVANNTTVRVGNSTVNSTMTGTQIAVGTNAYMNATTVHVGNSTVNSAMTGTQIRVGSNVVANSSSLQIGVGGNTVLITANSIDVYGNIETETLVVNQGITLGANLVLDFSELIVDRITSNNAISTSNGALVTSNTETTIDSTTVSPNNGIFAVKYFIAGSKLSNNEISQGMMTTEILALYDGSVVQSTQYASLESNTDVTISFTLVGTTMSLVVDCNDISEPSNYYVFNVWKTALRNVL